MLFLLFFRMQNGGENNFNRCLDWEGEGTEGKQMEAINDILGTVE